ncbi:hypothetical protein BS78_10G012700 [Paspalum vaginatum]|nr:hypothetical protein BS78_10G012700 [Paspalum vaginatum]
MRHVRAPDGAPPSSGGGGPVIEMASVPRSERPYAPLSTEDPSASRCHNTPTPLALHLVRSMTRAEISKVASCDGESRHGMRVAQLDPLSCDHAN